MASVYVRERQTSLLGKGDHETNMVTLTLFFNKS